MSYKINIQRRQFLKVGVLGSATLTFAAIGVSFSTKTESVSNLSWLQKDDLDLLQAIIPVILAGALPGDEIEYKDAVSEIVSGIDLTVSHFPPNIRDEIRELLWLLVSPASRFLLAGIWSTWDKAKTKDVHNFLKSWQSSNFDLLRVGYSALHDLITGAWYANPRSWQRIHYPGPPLIK